MPISIDEIEKIARLANLALTEEEKRSFPSQLAEIVDYIDHLNELETADIVPWSPRSAGEVATSHATREDGPLPGWEASLGTETAVAGAPDAEEGHFTVPRVIGG
jgi:aspartyl-tRNA(Asn)/glutamyl-tRNA(Gln) amidotransferase subunit C